MSGEGGDLGIAFGGDGEDVGVLGVDVAEELDGLFVAEGGGFVVEVAGGEDDDGGAVSEQRVGAVFELAGRVGLGVDVGGFFELEGTLAGDGVVDGAAEVEEGGGFVKGLGDSGDAGLPGGQGPADEVGEGEEFGDAGMEIGLVEAVTLMGERESEEVEDGDLGGEAFGGGDGDFFAGVGKEGGVGLAGHGGAGDVGDGDGVDAAGGGGLEGGEGVGGLAGLGDDEDGGVEDGIGDAVVELAGVLDVHGDAAEVFEDDLGEHAGVAAGAAGDDDEAVVGLEARRGRSARRRGWAGRRRGSGRGWPGGRGAARRSRRGWRGRRCGRLQIPRGWRTCAYDTEQTGPERCEDGWARFCRRDDGENAVGLGRDVAVGWVAVGLRAWGEDRVVLDRIVLDRGEATVVLEPYAANIVRVTLSLKKDAALAGPGYGITAGANAQGWTAESTEHGDGYRSARMQVTVGKSGHWTPTGTQADIAKFFNGSTPGVGISIRTPEGETLVEMQGWQMSVPNHKDGNADVLYDRRPTDHRSFRWGRRSTRRRMSTTTGWGRTRRAISTGEGTRCGARTTTTRRRGRAYVCLSWLRIRDTGLLWDNPSRTTVQFGFNDQTRWTSEVGQRVSFFVIAGKSYDEIYEGYRLLTGDVPMLPKSAYGYIQCKQRYTLAGGGDGGGEGVSRAASAGGCAGGGLVLLHEDGRRWIWIRRSGRTRWG